MFVLATLLPFYSIKCSLAFRYVYFYKFICVSLIFSTNFKFLVLIAVSKTSEIERKIKHFQLQLLQEFHMELSVISSTPRLLYS